MEILTNYREYFWHLLILIGIYSILAQGFNLTFGLGRLFNLAHIASYSIGAYATALCSVKLSCGFYECIVSSMLISALFSIAIGAISTKLAHDFFAIGTLAFSALTSAILINWKSLTNGVLGVTGIPRPQISTIDFNNDLNFLMLVIITAFVCQFVLYFIFRSPLARKLRAQAEIEHAAISLGMNVKQVRNWNFIISSAFAGLAGSLYAYYINFIDPSSFTFSETVFILSIVIIGRPGSFYGTLAAVVFLVLLPEPLRFLDISPSILGPMRQLLQAMILIVVVYFNRERLFPIERSV